MAPLYHLDALTLQCLLDDLVHVAVDRWALRSTYARSRRLTLLTLLTLVK
jgi:hypothetical protein